LWGYARAAGRRGVSLHTGTPVTAIEGAAGAFRLHTPKGILRAARVVCAAGAWSPEVARLADVALPDWPVRHEILSTEPLKPFLKPMVSVIESGLYFSQSLRGELVGGISMPEERGATREIRLTSSLAFLQTMARAMTEIMPCSPPSRSSGSGRPYDMSPDATDRRRGAGAAGLLRLLRLPGPRLHDGAGRRAALRARARGRDAARLLRGLARRSLHGPRPGPGPDGERETMTIG